MAFMQAMAKGYWYLPGVWAYLCEYLTLQCSRLTLLLSKYDFLYSYILHRDYVSQCCQNHEAAGSTVLLPVASISPGR